MDRGIVGKCKCFYCKIQSPPNRFHCRWVLLGVSFENQSSVPPSELLTGAELLQPIGLAMFKSSIMILLLAVLTVQVVQTAGELPFLFLI